MQEVNLHFVVVPTHEQELFALLELVQQELSLLGQLDHQLHGEAFRSWVVPEELDE